MTQIQKLVQKFKESPNSVSYGSIEKILLYFGFTKSYGKGSHVKFSHNDIPSIIIVPVHKKECKDIYKKHIHTLLSSNNLL